MLYLVMAIFSSALVSIVMRLSSDRVQGNISMLAMNYLMCLAIAAGGTGLDALFPRHPALPQTLAMGTVHGILYLLGFVMLQSSVKRNGVVLSATFMKLGLLVPMVLSVCLFGEQPGPAQIFGFFIAVAAILIINLDTSQSVMRFRAGLLLLLLCGGSGDAMSKIYEQLGEPALSGQFLLYTFLSALLLCLALMVWKGERPGKNEVLFGLLIGIPNFCSAKFLLKSLESVAAVIAYPTYSVATIFVVTLAGVLLFRETLGRRQWLAIGIILVALALLNL